MAIAARPSKLPAQIAFVDIGYSPLVLIAPTIQCPITEKLINNSETIDWSELEFIVAEQGFSRQRLEQWWRKNNVQGKIYAQVAGHEAMVSMVSLGLGVAMIPKIVLDNSPLNDKVQILDSKDEPPQGFKIGLAVLHKELNDPAISALWNIAQNMGENII
jgi:LysR family positive regulator for ilvC